MSELLYSPVTLRGLTLHNRVVMAPMTRSRAIDNVPNELMATYYAQRAGAGLIITEGTAPSPNGLGYARIPGLYDAAQVAGWRLVTDAVHAAGSKIFVQLMHTGRVSHPLNMPAGARIVAPSAIALEGTMYTDAQGMVAYPAPEALDEAGIQAAIHEYVHASALAIEAGFDGVELHGANGYLIDQFLNTASNHREDQWGGSIENRARFALAVTEAVIARIGADKVGIRLSPYGVFSGMTPDPDMDALFTHLAGALGKLGILYLHTVDHSSMGAPPVPAALKDAMRQAFGGTVVLSGGYDAARAEADLEAGRGELVAFGRPYLSNPNLVEKLRTGAALTPPDFSSFYSPGPKGYTDYPLD